MDKPIIHKGEVSKFAIFLNMIMASIYLSWWFLPGHVGNIYLYSLLVFGEVYHVLLSFTFWYTIWPSVRTDIGYSHDVSYLPTVDIFITVAGEPEYVVEKTILACKNMYYPYAKIYVLNDGYVAKAANWREIEELAHALKVKCITRKHPGGAKAGNINYALKRTKSELVVIFDADMRPFSDFLLKIVPYFSDAKMAFVQSPQYYKNHSSNAITAGSWEQQEFFFGPVMIGKNKSNSAFICGTNCAIRRSVLVEVGGMDEKNIAEDFLTSLAIHKKKWKSYYVSEVLAQGLAPADLLSYYKQQLRWARGSLEVLFIHNPIFKFGLSWRQRLEYLSSALFYFNGVVVLIDMIMPIIYLFTGIMPVATTTTSFALFFIPFMSFNLYTLYSVSEGFLTFRAISFSQSSWVIQLRALASVLTGANMGFSVTSKESLKGNFLYLVYPHLFYIFITIVAASVGIIREGWNASIITNIAWATFNCLMFMPFIISALSKVQVEEHLRIKKRQQKYSAPYLVN